MRFHKTWSSASAPANADKKEIETSARTRASGRTCRPLRDGFAFRKESGWARANKLWRRITRSPDAPACAGKKRGRDHAAGSSRGERKLHPRGRADVAR